MSIEPTEPIKQPSTLRAAILLLCAAVFLVAGYAVWSGVDSQRRADDAVAALKQHDHDAAQDRAAAARDRRTAAENQKALLDYTAALAARQDALLAYLRVHGIHLPQRLVTVVPPPRIVVHDPRAAHHVKRHRSLTSSTPAGPGKSGSAPGHHKHPRHGHRHR